MVEKEIVDLVHLLESYTRIHYDKGAEVTTPTGVTLPPVPFTSFPLLRCVVEWMLIIHTFKFADAYLATDH